MNDKPTRDDYNQLIDQLGSSDRNDGPDILAVNHRREENRAAQPQRQTSGEQPQRRVTQYTPGADRQRRQSSASGHSAHSRSASSHSSQQRSASSKRTPAAQQAHPAPHTTKKRKTKEKKPGFGGGAWLRAIIIALILVACAVALALFALSSASDLFGLHQEDKQV